MNNKILYNSAFRSKNVVDNITGNECDANLELNMSIGKKRYIYFDYYLQNNNKNY